MEFARGLATPLCGLPSHGYGVALAIAKYVVSIVVLLNLFQ